MKSDHEKGPFSMVQFHGPTSMIRLLKKVVLKALDPSIGVNQMWTKKNDHASESECAKISLATQMKKKMFGYKCARAIVDSMRGICLHQCSKTRLQIGCYTLQLSPNFML